MKKRIVLSLLLCTVVVLGAVGCVAEEPFEDMWTQSIYPASNDTYIMGSPSLYYHDGYFTDLHVSNDSLYIGDMKVTGQELSEFLKGGSGNCSCKDGENGYTPIKGIDYFDGLPGINGSQGPKGDTGEQGTQGLAGVNGSDANVTKENVEAVLTGIITSHSHTDNYGYTIQVQALTFSPADNNSIYFGMLPRAPSTTAATNKVYVRQACTLNGIEIYCYSGTAGTAEVWQMFVRKNNTTDYWVCNVSIANKERVFSNMSMGIGMMPGDYFEIKMINPPWVTNPLTTIFGGYAYFQ
jgi:hypothetical protein